MKLPEVRPQQTVLPNDSNWLGECSSDVTEMEVNLLTASKMGNRKSMDCV